MFFLTQGILTSRYLTTRYFCHSRYFTSSNTTSTLHQFSRRAPLRLQQQHEDAYIHEENYVLCFIWHSIVNIIIVLVFIKEIYIIVWKPHCWHYHFLHSLSAILLHPRFLIELLVLQSLREILVFLQRDIQRPMFWEINIKVQILLLAHIRWNIHLNISEN